MSMPFPDPGKGGQWIFLSHVLSSRTPAYGGGQSLTITPDRAIACGHSSNSVMLNFSNHLGSHVDAPRHFVETGRTVDDYRADEWIFSAPFVADVKAGEGGVIGIPEAEWALAGCNDADLVLFRTGFERVRDSETYWSSAPGFDPLLCDYLRGRLPSLRAIGMDTISLSSMMHRDMGRAAHRVFLGQGIRIFEDLALNWAPKGGALQVVVAFPLLYENSDGSPCTMAGLI
jgi:arylformamidase